MDNNSNILVSGVRIKSEIIERIKGRDDVKPALAKALKIHPNSVSRLLNENAVNGALTKFIAIDTICDILSMQPSEVTVQITESCVA